MNKNNRFILALAFSMAMLSIPSVATANAVTIDVVGGTLIAKSAGATVSINVTCNLPNANGNHLTVNMTLTQRSGTGVGSFSTDQLTCDGNPQLLEGIVAVQNPGKFKKGPAIVQGSYNFTSSDFNLFETGPFSQETEIK